MELHEVTDCFPDEAKTNCKSKVTSSRSPRPEPQTISRKQLDELTEKAKITRRARRVFR